MSGETTPERRQFDRWFDNQGLLERQRELVWIGWFYRGRAIERDNSPVKLLPEPDGLVDGQDRIRAAREE